MNQERRKVIKEIKTNKLLTYRFLKRYETMGINEKLDLVAKLAVYNFRENKVSKSENSKIITLILEDVEAMEKQKKRVRKLHNNYDTYMYTVHHLSYGISSYKDISYNLDCLDERNALINILLNDKIIKISDSNYKFVNKKVIDKLKLLFIYKEEDNYRLCSRAIVLNLKEIGILKS